MVTNSISQPKVTVFMPVYNTERYIEESIWSILKQSFRDFELLIIDDGSSDRSLEIINSINDSRIRVVQNEINKGLPYTRNLGLKLARGEYFAIMDSDDIARYDRLEKQVTYLNENKDISIVASNYLVLNDGKVRKSRFPVFKISEMKIQLLFRNYLLNSSAMVRKELLTKKSITYDLNFFSCQDYMFWSDCLKFGKVYTDKQFLITYRTGHENVTKLTQHKRKEERKRLVDYIHNDALKFHGFNFSIKEQELFNNLFGEENILDMASYDNSIQLLNKMIHQNEELNLFKEGDLRNVIQYNFLLTVLLSEYLSIREKYKLFFKEKTWFAKNFNWFMYFFPRLVKRSLI